MPDCAPPPAASVITLDRPATKLRSETRKTVKTKAPVRVKFYSAYAEAVDPLARPQDSFIADHTAPPPLFQVHCSFLI